MKKDLSVSKISTDKLIPYARNARTHSDSQVAQIAASIKEFGFNNPVLVDSENGIIAGHGRILAAQKLGLAEVPCIVLDHLNENQKRAFVLADNKLALNAGWDEEMLAEEIKSLNSENFDMALTGFDEKELKEFLNFKMGNENTDAEPQIDKADELREKWGVETGQLWRLGDHRLLCGDSTKENDVAMALDGSVPVLMVTDPPYGVEYDSSWRVRAGVQEKTVNCGKVENDDIADWEKSYSLFPGSVAYIWHADVHSKTVAQNIEDCGFEIKYLIIWNKDLAVFGRGDYHHKHEPCWYAVKKGRNHSWIGDRKQKTVWDIPTIHSFKNGKNSEEWGLSGHGTQKPIECMSMPIRNHDSEFVYEPFSGSGTTIMACEQLGRKCRAIEISPAYVAIALQRWADATGGTPEVVK